MRITGQAARDLAKTMGVKSTRRHKYGAKATVVDGIEFASKKEAKRYTELKIMQDAGLIFQLELQPTFELHALGGKEVCQYIADFSYWDKKLQTLVFEDAKGFRTPMYRLKKKWVEAEYGITISEV